MKTRTVPKKGAYKFPQWMKFGDVNYYLIKLYRLKSEAQKAAVAKRGHAGGSARVVGPRWSIRTYYKDNVSQEYVYALYVHTDKRRSIASSYKNIGGQRYKYIHADLSKSKADALAAKWRIGGLYYGPIRTRVIRKKRKQGTMYLVYLNCKDYKRETKKKC